MPAINPERLLGDLYALRGIGMYKTGVHRPTFSPEDIVARQWLADRMTEAGLDAQIDGIGNVVGFSRARGRKILAGSHIESQNYAGWLDGPLGVIYALEAARALREDPVIGDAGVDSSRSAMRRATSAFSWAAALSSVRSRKPTSITPAIACAVRRCARRWRRRATPAGRD